MKFRKKPVVIDAIQWTGSNPEECVAFLGASFGGHQAGSHPPYNELIVKTLEGQHIASEGDYLIRGIKGEHYPCKPSVFEQTYEPVGPMRKEADQE